MSLLDTIDGSFMNFAYGWAFSKPVRKVFYNLTITGLSVAVALVIGTIELAGLLAQQLERAGPLLELGREHRHQHARLHHRRHVRRHLGARALGLALRAHRGALERRPGGDAVARSRCKGQATASVAAPTAAWPKLMPPSPGGSRWATSARRPPARSAPRGSARAGRRFWKTPPDSTTSSSPLPGQPRAQARAVARARPR